MFLGVARGPDLLRLVAVPVFAWAAYRDIETRRVPNRTWLPLLVAGVVALAWDGWLVLDQGAFSQRLFAVRVVLSLGLVAPLGYVFWRLGGFGGADAKAVISLAVLFPVYPSFYLELGALPLNRATLGVFSLTILSNTVIVGLAYPLLLALRNLPRGEVTPAMFVGRPVAVADVLVEYGRLLEGPDGFSRRGLDVDALRMYLRWRGVTFEQIRANPDRYRHPLPAARNDPGDGSIAADERALTDGGVVTESESADDSDSDAAEDELQAAIRPLDTWGAERFLSAHSAYGTTPTELREGLEVLTESDRERVWLTPGIPFILPMFAGLLFALTYGDLLFALLTFLGLA
ncbi:prepilin peptidase [Natronomonas salina]|uniref:A24 family peptidase n=1 Tax=Natronomonas salina TaxID=1710540 RepID=UPI0015B5BDD5|nr:A24 family peptidase [Natronomonas salina]QLD91273.1 prepilin peptidase [Natronomonas salina]